MKGRRIVAWAWVIASMLQAGTVHPAPPQKAGKAALAKAVGPTVGAPQTDVATGLKFVSLPAGCFTMGSPEPVHPEIDTIWRHLGYQAPIDDDERPTHEVCLDAFSIGQTEVTAAAWLLVMGVPPALGQGQEPASGISWVETQRYLEKINAGLGRPRYRLPTEAEWEYACRAGVPKEDARSIDGQIDGAWYATDSRRRSQPAEVAQLPANNWGLHDMLGNVWEWTTESYRREAYGQHALYNPRVRDGSGDRAIRGASFRSEYLQVRCAVRGSYAPDETLPQIGFRLVKVE